MTDGPDSRPTPMFPLGSVTFPGSVLPLRVFEPRYRVLVSRCLATDGRFGTVLIDRGSEVGGGDERTGIGCLVEIVDARSTRDDHLQLVTVGVERIEITEWLPDDPHPLASIRELPTSAPSRGSVDDAAAAFDRFLTIAVELGRLAAVPTIEPLDDPVAAMWRLCAMAPMDSADRQELLVLDDGDQRLARFREMLDEQEEILRFQGPRRG